MNRVRVLVANQPRLMRELILATISDQPDIEVVGEVDNASDVPNLVAEMHPDFLIIALESPSARPAICDLLLPQYFQLKILAVDPERNRSVLYWASLELHSGVIESSEQGVLSALRSSRAYLPC